APVYGNLYGTPRSALTDMMEQGLDVLLEIDTQGAMQIKKKFQDAVFIYILPPSIEALRQRLQRRGDAPEDIQRRLQKVREEIWSYRDYCYIVRNDDLMHALKELEAVILAERIKTKRLDIAWLEENFIRERDEKQADRGGAVTT
ncbi:MAG: guanylate kinase, partial [Nitrospira sp.]|nr:guanylate kinase [Nitrospira sp.]